jgi:hypothetical protein
MGAENITRDTVYLFIYLFIVIVVLLTAGKEDETKAQEGIKEKRKRERGEDTKEVIPVEFQRVFLR